jgi:hypothetical protein
MALSTFKVFALFFACELSLEVAWADDTNTQKITAIAVRNNFFILFDFKN